METAGFLERGRKYAPQDIAPGTLDRKPLIDSHAFQDKLKEYGMTCSTTRKENCCDNAPKDSGLNSFKNERVYGLRYATHAETCSAALDYIEVFYNRLRQHSMLACKSPVQFLANWTREQHRKNWRHYNR